MDSFFLIIWLSSWMGAIILAIKKHRSALAAFFFGSIFGVPAFIYYLVKHPIYKRKINREEKKELEAKLSLYIEKIKEVAEDGYLSKEEEKELEELRTKLGLTKEDVSQTEHYLNFLRMISKIKDGDLPVVESDLLLKKGEICHYMVNCELIEEKTRTRYVGGTSGVSFRIAKGVSWRVGGFQGERIRETFKETTDNGQLYVTNKKVVFVGSRKTISYPLNKIIKIVKYSDAIQIQKENESKLKYFAFNSKKEIDIVGALVHKLVSNLT